MVQKIQLTESELRGYVETMVRESLDRILQQDMLNEGKFARALGAAALGAGLALGHPTDANAQLQNVRLQSEMPQEPEKPSGFITDDLHIYCNSDNDRVTLFYQSIQERGNFDLGYAGRLGFSDAKQTLYDLGKLITNQTTGVYVSDDSYVGREFRVYYDGSIDAIRMEGPGTHVLCLRKQDIEKAIQCIDKYEQWKQEYADYKKEYDAWAKNPYDSIDDVLNPNHEEPESLPTSQPYETTKDPASEYQRLKVLLKNTQKELGNAKYNTYNVDSGFVRVKEQQVQAIKARMKELEAQMKQ